MTSKSGTMFIETPINSNFDHPIITTSDPSPSSKKMVRDTYKMLSQAQFSLRRCKREHKNQEDRFDDLPEEIVSSIVSYFTPRVAARARLLSSTWRQRCSTTSIIDFHHSDIFTTPPNAIRYHQLRDMFVKAVNQFLLCQKDNSRLDGIRIMCCLHRDSTSDIDAWIRFAVSRGVKNLCLSLGGADITLYDEKYILHAELLSPPNNITQVRLTSCLLGPGVIDHFHSIKNLKLISTFISLEEMESIGCYCCNLERFTLTHSNVPSKLCISASSFRRLKFLGTITCHGLEEIEISSNNLTSFEYGGHFIKICFSRAPNLINVYFRAQDTSGINYLFYQLAKDLPLVKTLSIDTGKINWIKRLPNEKAIFSNVKTLELSFHNRMVPNFLALFAHLEAFPLLEKLYLAIEFEVSSYKETKIVVNERLKEVHITGFYNCTPLMHLALHFLKLGVGLEKMVLDLNYRNYVGAGRWVHSKREYEDKSEYQEISDRFVGRFKVNVIVLQ